LSDDLEMLLDLTRQLPSCRLGFQGHLSQKATFEFTLAYVLTNV